LDDAQVLNNGDQQDMQVMMCNCDLSGLDGCDDLERVAQTSLDYLIRILYMPSPSDLASANSHTVCGHLG
jgi:hypothetical protein